MTDSGYTHSSTRPQPRTHRHPRRQARAASRTLAGLLAALATGLALAGCGSAVSTEGLPDREDGITDIVVTTPILADVARNIAGDAARVTALIPPNADPHTHELTLRDVRNLANADVAFTNGLYLEEQSVVRTVNSGVLDGTPVVPVAEEASKHGATVIPLVENLSLDTVWLGLRAVGLGKQMGGSATSVVDLAVTDVQGPGDAAAYVTGTFGQPEIFFNSADGLDTKDHTILPPDAHTHMSWAFSEPGTYKITFDSRLDNKPVAKETVEFAVGVAPSAADSATSNGPSGDKKAGEGASGGKKQIDTGHQDIAINLDERRMSIVGDSGDNDITRSVVVVPPKALQQIPAGADFRFLGIPGSETYLLPQAVLGKHVHGELDPHLWHSVDNMRAIVEVIKEHLAKVDPRNAQVYSANASAYEEQLIQLDHEMRDTLETIPERHRHLVTAHDGYAYLAKTYGLDVAGFVTPNPAVEPSARDLIALTRTLENLEVPAVFLEPNMVGRAADLKLIAHNVDVNVCTIHGDTFHEDVDTYLKLMRTNAHTIARCLGGKP